MSHKPALNKQTRCTHRTANGRRCQMPFAPNHTSLCAQHALQELQLHDSKLITEEILGPLDDFRSAYAVNRALGKLFTLTSENRIPVRSAVALAYIGQLLLQSLPPLRDEFGNGGMEAIATDAVLRLGDELPQVPPFCREEDSRPPIKALIRESLTILRDAGYDLPAQLIPNRKQLDEDGVDEEGGDESDDENNE